MIHYTKLCVCASVIGHYALCFNFDSLFQTCQRTGSVRCQRRCVSLSLWRRSACTTTVCDPSHPACASCKPSPTSTSGKTNTHLQIQAHVPHTHIHIICSVQFTWTSGTLLNAAKTFRGQLVFNKRNSYFIQQRCIKLTLIT